MMSVLSGLLDFNGVGLFVPLGVILAWFILTAGITLDIFVLRFFFTRPAAWRLAVEKLRAAPWTWKEGNILLGLSLAFGAAVSLMASAQKRWEWPPSGHEAPLLLFLLRLSLPVTLLLAVLALVRKRNMSWSQAFGLSRPRAGRDIRRGVIFFLAAFPAVTLTAALADLLLLRLGFPVHSQSVVIDLVSPATAFWSKIQWIFLAMMVAPVVEEMVFRGVALPIATRMASPLTGVILISLLFAALHGHLPSFSPLLVMAVAFSIAYIYSGSILVPMVMHALFNTVNMLILFLMRTAA